MISVVIAVLQPQTDTFLNVDITSERLPGGNPLSRTKATGSPRPNASFTWNDDRFCSSRARAYRHPPAEDEEFRQKAAIRLGGHTDLHHSRRCSRPCSSKSPAPELGPSSRRWRR